MIWDYVYVDEICFNFFINRGNPILKFFANGCGQTLLLVFRAKTQRDIYNYS